MKKKSIENWPNPCLTSRKVVWLIVWEWEVSEFLLRLSRFRGGVAYHIRPILAQKGAFDHRWRNPGSPGPAQPLPRGEEVPFLAKVFCFFCPYLAKKWSKIEHSGSDWGVWPNSGSDWSGWRISGSDSASLGGGATPPPESPISTYGFDLLRCFTSCLTSIIQVTR